MPNGIKFRATCYTSNYSNGHRESRTECSNYHQLHSQFQQLHGWLEQYAVIGPDRSDKPQAVIHQDNEKEGGDFAYSGIPLRLITSR